MGILSKIFKRKSKGIASGVTSKRAKQLAKLSPEIAPMAEAGFWKIIASVTGKKKKTHKEWEEALEKKLKKMRLDQILAFQFRVDELMMRSYHEDLLCACAILEGTTDKVAFEGFRCWIIMHGKDTFLRVLNDPDAIVEILSDGVEDHYFSVLQHIAIEFFVLQSGKKPEDAGDYRTVQSYPELFLNWKLQNPDSMRAVCPRLFEHAQFV
jgi:hypothetical protein